MAALSARMDAVLRNREDVRRESEELRAAVVTTVRASRRRRHECLPSYAYASRIVAQPIRSPWSDLSWQPAGPELDQVLVLVPGER
jgi:hypothetical protein